MTPDITAVFLRWMGLRAVLHRGYWLVASLYLVVDAHLSAFQLVFLGTAQGIISLVCEVPAGVVALLVITPPVSPPCSARYTPRSSAASYRGCTFRTG